ncbi:(2Fe-2S)-binding protein [Pseudooceanicola lipolyticus]|uniref:(2Fe-2S)-binding protein n=2 Tax=Paracoccaceae TaxID=31989 RepID=A0A2M8J029_9RHOB|nr:(2Fe-2S)-binding protein [Pseudooceanicola lipolyticus]
MIVCHCQSISDSDIHSAIDWMRASDQRTLITPGKVYRALGKSADCGGCMPLFLATMRKNDNLQVTRDDNPVPMHLRSLRTMATQERQRHEGRSQGY